MSVKRVTRPRLARSGWARKPCHPANLLEARVKRYITLSGLADWDSRLPFQDSPAIEASASSKPVGATNNSRRIPSLACDASQHGLFSFLTGLVSVPVNQVGSTQQVISYASSLMLMTISRNRGMLIILIV